MDKESIEKLVNRNVEEIIPSKDSLINTLKEKGSLRVKYGIDPTGPKLHLGTAVALNKLKEFQELGHQIVLIFGDFTAQIGDPSDKLERRPELKKEEVEENLKDYKEQIGLILDNEKIEWRRNSEWLSDLDLSKFFNMTREFTINRILSRHNFKKRIEENKDIGLEEILYSLLQGYDSVAVEADIEIGGTDQLFNCQIARDLQDFFGQEKETIMTMEMLVGIDGRKMSTSWGNVINIKEEPYEQYSQVMSMNDDVIFDYFYRTTQLSEKAIKDLKDKFQNNKISAKELKHKLAFEIVSQYRGEDTAEKARNKFKDVFEKGEVPDDVETKEIEEPIFLPEFLVEIGWCDSKTEAKKIIEQGGLYKDDDKIKDWSNELEVKEPIVIRKGKKEFIRLLPQD